MSSVCPVCGLPKELCACAAIAKAKQKIVVQIVEKRYRKKMTVIKGLDIKEENLKQLARQLKERLACGGTVKEHVIELQGDHKNKMRSILTGLGFAPDSIEIR